ncbi:MAG: hypothetical protein WCK93_12685 [Nitrosomonadales bacterium]
MTQAHTAALESAQRTEDYQRADFEAILSALVKKSLEDFDTIKTYCITKANRKEEDRTGSDLKAGIDELLEGFVGLAHYAGAIRSGEVHNWH